MGVRRLTRTGLMAAAAIALSAVTASAQVVYTTSGVFSGGTGFTSCAGGTSCTVDGFTLSFNRIVTPTNYTAPTLVDLGDFTTAQSGGTAGLTAFTGASFTLMITQTSPSAGSGSFTGLITGSLAYNPSSSSLIWTPSSSTLSIGNTTYVLVTDNTGNININAPTIEAGKNPNTTSVKANVSVSVAPEPATALLLAPGLAGLGLAARFRRRRSSK